VVVVVVVVVVVKSGRLRSCHLMIAMVFGYRQGVDEDDDEKSIHIVIDKTQSLTFRVLKQA